MNVRDLVDYVEEQRKVVDKRYNNFSNIDYTKVVYVYSSLYNDVVYVNGEDLINGEFNVEKYGLDKDFFDYPFYIRIESKGIDDLRNEIIDKLPDSYFIMIDCNERTTSKKYKDNILYCPYGNWIDFDFLYDRYLDGNLYFINDFSPVIEIKKVDSMTINKLNRIKKVSSNDGTNFRYRVIVKDKETLERLPDLLKELEDEVFIFVDDYLFDGCKNKESARSVLMNSAEFEQKFSLSKRKYLIDYNGVSFNDFSHVLGLEKCIDVLISRIPSDASSLDKVVFLTMFMISHFSYDYDDPEKIRDLFDFINDQKGVCRDYAALTKCLFERVGVVCCNTGGFSEDKSVGHAFNIVYFDDKKTLLDVTWLAEQYKNGEILSIIQSNNFLTDTATFGHEDFLDERHDGCVKIDRADIVKSILKVRGWKYKYYINKEMIIDLLKKGPKKKSDMEFVLETSMPGYGL